MTLKEQYRKDLPEINEQNVELFEVSCNDPRLSYEPEDLLANAYNHPLLINSTAVEATLDMPDFDQLEDLEYDEDADAHRDLIAGLGFEIGNRLSLPDIDSIEMNSELVIEDQEDYQEFIYRVDAITSAVDPEMAQAAFEAYVDSLNPEGYEEFKENNEHRRDGPKVKNDDKDLTDEILELLSNADSEDLDEPLPPELCEELVEGTNQVLRDHPTPPSEKKAVDQITESIYMATVIKSYHHVSLPIPRIGRIKLASIGFGGIGTPRSERVYGVSEEDAKKNIKGAILSGARATEKELEQIREEELEI